MNKRCYSLEEITINFDKDRKPLSAQQRKNMQGEYRYFGAQNVIDYVNDFLFEGEYLLIAEDGENLKSNKQNIAQIVSGRFWLSNHAHIVKTNELCNIRYLMYWLNSTDISGYITGSAQPKLSQTNLNAIRINLPDRIVQDKIVNILYCFDKKIDMNKRINRNLQEQALAIYRKMFVETNNNARVICRTDEFFDITIGKTPPRKEKEWFSNDPKDCVWISISDMGSCGIFITDSSEYLTQASVDKYNVKVVPENTVILSFKLTVGRIAITVGKTTTNEAIAHFNTSKKNITEYLYCYLKSFDFGALGSTSSIGTAVNSKTIKTMKFVIPEEWELQKFYDIARPMFEQIKKNQFENQNLVTIRDVLLPKLMVGELDVSDLNI